jgi:hypothetical protein
MAAQSGITKREYFAAMAMQGLVANSELSEKHGIPQTETSELAVKMADALIAELNKEPKP